MSSHHGPWSACFWRCTLLVVSILSFIAVAGESAHADELPGVPGVQWTIGPARVNLGNVATLQVPAGYRFTGNEGARKFIGSFVKDIPDAAMVGVLIPPEKDWESNFWHLRVGYRAVGHVKDDDKATLTDAGATTLLKQIREATDVVNKERRRLGHQMVRVLGWEQKPHYDAQTKCLTWAIRSAEGDISGVNYDSRVLGRGGVVEVKMVAGLKQSSSLLPAFRKIVHGIQFKSGQTYAEFRKGDKTAEHTLTGLVTGVALVSGTKLWKILVPIGLAVAASIAGIGKKIMGKSDKPAQGAATASPPEATQPQPEQATIVIACPACGRQNRLVAGRQETPRCGSCRTPLQTA